MCYQTVDKAIATRTLNAYSDADYVGHIGFKGRNIDEYNGTSKSISI